MRKRLDNGDHRADSPSVPLGALAEEFGVSIKILQTAARFGAIRAIKIPAGHFWMADRESVRRFVARRRRATSRQQIEAR